MISIYSLGKLLLWNLCRFFVVLFFFFFLAPVYGKQFHRPQCVSCPQVCWVYQSEPDQGKVHQGALPTCWISFSQQSPDFGSKQSASVHGCLRCETCLDFFPEKSSSGSPSPSTGESALLPGQKQAVLIVNSNLFQQRTRRLWMHCPDAYVDYEELIFWMLLSEKDSKLWPRHEG